VLKTTSNLVKLTAKWAAIIYLSIYYIKRRKTSSIKKLKLSLIKVKVSEEFSNSIFTIRN